MKVKLSFWIVFISICSWSQTTQTFNANRVFTVPAGVTSLSVQAWGGGGSGGGAAGAGLLFGRGAAGGGGGAYASAPISVTPSEALNVVVAGQTSGTIGANGTAGGNSTITGFETSILAAGGSGGAGNAAGGTPAGGLGGSVASSAGATRLAGTNGGDGNSWSLLSLLLSSGAGGAGANAGGAGGASVSSLLFGNAPGNAGTAPGGAGSGAINSAGGVSQIGGTGGAGRVAITYDCPAYSLTSTDVTNICAGEGTTSTVFITGTAVSLPVGSYVVTYNRSNPSGIALTANMTVSTAGTGTFTAVGLTNTGSSTLTITKLTSASCVSDITTNNTASVFIFPATGGGMVTGGSSICSGNTSDVLTLSGHVGAAIKWQFAVSPFTTWTDVPNQTINTTYVSVPLTETTQFRAVVGVGSGACGAVNSEATTVTVSDEPSLIFNDTSTSICLNNDASGNVFFPYTWHMGDPVTYSIVWDSSPANNFVAVNNETLPANNGPVQVEVPAGTPAGTYTGTLTVTNAEGCTGSGTAIAITVSPLPSIQFDIVQGYLCMGTTISELIKFGYHTPEGSPITYSISWDSNFFAAVNDEVLPNKEAIEIVVPAGTPGGDYTGTLTVKNAEGCVSEGVLIYITVYTTPELDNNPEFSACSDDEYATLLVTLNSNIPITYYAIDWDSSSLPFQGDTPFNLAMDNVIVPDNLPDGIYTGTMFYGNDRCGTNCPITLRISNCTELARESGSSENNVSVNVFNKVLNIDSSQANINQVFVYDVSGNLIFKKDAVSDSKLIINNLRSGNQVLVVKVVLDNNKVETKKVVY